MNRGTGHVKTFCRSLHPQYASYLGCTNVNWENQERTWHINGRISNNLTGWKARTLSKAGKVVIIKSNPASFPVQYEEHTLPNILLGKLIGSQKVLLEEWERLWPGPLFDPPPIRTNFVGQNAKEACTSGKSRHEHSNNCKTWTRTSKENIWMEVLTSKYLTIDDFLDVKKMANPSRIWKYILHHSNLKKKLLDIRKWKEYQLLVKQMDERLPSNSINPGD